MPDLKIEYLKRAQIKPYDRNARTHSDEQVGIIAESIKEFGFTNPLLIDEKRGMIAGHGRLMAAERLGIDPVPTITIRGLSAAQRRALVIADNQTALRSGWDENLLRAEIEALALEGFALPTLGFDAEALTAILTGKTTDGLTDPDDAPEPPVEPVSRLGDVWLLGDHRLICGDATDKATVEKLLGADRPSLLLTDPPYGIGYEYDQHKDAKGENARLVERAFAHAPAAKVWTPGLMNLARDLQRFGTAKVLAWHKGFAAAGNGLGGASTWEPILVIAPPRRNLDDDHLRFSTDREKIDGTDLRHLHTCPKPVALFAHLAEAFLPRGGIADEPFSGSGTTIIAAEMTGRRCLAIELSPAYVDVCVQRWASFTGKVAHLDATGSTFAETAAQRAQKPASAPKAKAWRKGPAQKKTAVAA